MASSNVGGAMSKRLAKVSKEIKGADRAAVTKAAAIVRDSALREVARASGGDSRLSGVGRKGAKVGVRQTVAVTPKGAEATVFATGPLQFIERDTKAGVRHRRRGRRGRTFSFGAGPQRGAGHPGTTGKFPFKRGVERARPKAVKALGTSMSDALKRGFR